jgi:glutathione S-transferase
MRLLGGELSPFTARARLALELRGVPYELVDEQLVPRKSERLLAANPVYGKIPVLLLPDGRAICESAVIVQYVDEASDDGSGSSSRLMPEDPYQRAMHRFWTAFVDDRFWPALDAVSLGPTREARAQAVADARAALQLLEEAFRSSRSGDDDKSFFSTMPGLLDVALWAASSPRSGPASGSTGSHSSTPPPRRSCTAGASGSPRCPQPGPSCRTRTRW